MDNSGRKICWANTSVQELLAVPGARAALMEEPQPGTPDELQAIFFELRHQMLVLRT